MESTPLGSEDTAGMAAHAAPSGRTKTSRHKPAVTAAAESDGQISSLLHLATRGFADGLLAITRWGFCAILIAAPWMYGCTRDWTKELLAWLLAGLAGLFFCALLFRWRLPRIAPVAAVLTLVLLSYGLGMAYNANSAFVPGKFVFDVIEPPYPNLPGAVDRSRVLDCLKLLAGMTGAFWVTCDLAANPVWRRRVWFSIGAAGVSILLLGLLQKISGAQDIFWQTYRDGGTFFGTYHYHANAGAFINLVLPFIVGRAMLAFRTDESQIAKASWCLASLIAAVCPFVSVSRGAMLVSVVILGALGIWLFARFIVFIGRRRGAHSPVIWFAIAALLVGGVALGAVVNVGSAWDVWQSEGMTPHSRDMVYDAVWNHMIPVSGLWGFGPGTFEITFPFYTQYLGDRIGGIWVYAHNDYLETITEWGWIGAGLWAALFFGGMGYAVWKLCRPGRRMGPDSRFLLITSLISLGGVLLHSIVDFPLQIASLQLYAAVALGFLWSVGRPAHP